MTAQHNASRQLLLAAGA